MSFRSRGNRNAEARSVTANRDSSLSGADGRRARPQFWFRLEVTTAAERRAAPEKSQNRRATGWESVSNGDQLAYPEQRKWISGDAEGCACSGSHGRGRRFETCSAHPKPQVSPVSKAGGLTCLYKLANLLKGPG
jgi:hypothetical protein